MLNPKAWQSTGLLIFVLVTCTALVAASGYRVQRNYYNGPQQPPRVGGGFCDFFNGVYYPTRAFFAQDNPYTPQYAEQYPVSRPVPPFSPLVFAIHAPFACFAPDLSAKLYFVWLMVLTCALAALMLGVSGRPVTLATVAAVASYLLFTRSGQVTVFNGYFSFLLAMGVIVALHYGQRRPLLSGLGLALASCKPTYAIPLVLLMLCRGHLKATAIGVCLSALFLASGLGWLAADDGFPGAVANFVQSEQAHGEYPNLWPVNTWTRIDLLAIAAKWKQWQPEGMLVTLGPMLVILAVPCGLLLATKGQSSSRSSDTGASGLVGLLCMLAMLVSIYHHFYDALILVVPTLAMIGTPTGDWQRIGRLPRAALACLINLPLLNYLSSYSILQRLDLQAGSPAYAAITSINGICLAIALAFAAVLVWRQHARQCARGSAVVCPAAGLATTPDGT
jgi:hypothetical protein